jgi:hypothetical protein
VASFAKVPGIPSLNLEDIKRPPHPGTASSAASSQSDSQRILSRDEPCFVTNSIRYTNEQAHWISAVGRDPASKADVVRDFSDFDNVHSRRTS